jgi:AraC-like DNA-binding protein
MGSADLPTSFRMTADLSAAAMPAAAQTAWEGHGPLGEAVRRAPSLREALRCLADHVQAWNSELRLCLETLPDDGRAFLMLEAPAHPGQATEQALALLRQGIAAISGGQVRICGAWLAHEPLAPLASYRAPLGSTLRFGQAVNGLFLDAQDLDLPLPGSDAQRYEAATRLLAQQYPALPRSMSLRVHLIVAQLLAAGTCTHDRVAASLGLHPRTLQRRLREEGRSFETIKDQVRRDVALRHLGRSNVSLVQMTEILGYSETSVLTRSCQRWFSASPRQLRKHQRRGLAEASSCAT